VLIFLLAAQVRAQAQAQAPAQQSLEIAAPENAAIVPVALTVLQQAYAKLGVSVKIRSLPLRRGVQLADAGELDGDLMHSLPSLKEWAQLVVVKVPVARAVFSAYKQGPDCPASVKISELSAARVAYMRGTRSIEDALPAKALRAANNNLDALLHVQRGVTDYAVAGQLETDALIIKYKLHDICKVAEPVLVSELYHSLNKRHEQLADRVEHVLQEMQERGEIKQIWAAEARRAQKSVISLP
jgi:ABC-type amino acid transport substrate-binding protein